MDERKKELFFQQLRLLDTFLKNGAISKDQYETSYRGLVEKMGIPEAELPKA